MIHGRISGLTMRGFRRFQEPTHFAFAGPDSQPPATLVVAGPNGCGKTSFFEAIQYALGREETLHRELSHGDLQHWLRSALSPDVEVKLTMQIGSAPGTLLGTRTPCTLEITRALTQWRITLLEGSSGFLMGVTYRIRARSRARVVSPRCGPTRGEVAAGRELV